MRSVARLSKTLGDRLDPLPAMHLTASPCLKSIKNWGGGGGQEKGKQRKKAPYLYLSGGLWSIKLKNQRYKTENLAYLYNTF